MSFAFAVFYEMRAASLRGSPSQAKSLSQKLLQLQQEAGQYAVPNDFGARLSQAGAVNLNASTSHDATQYTASLPSNKLELWFALEADRFQVLQSRPSSHFTLLYTETWYNARCYKTARPLAYSR